MATANVDTPPPEAGNVYVPPARPVGDAELHRRRRRCRRHDRDRRDPRRERGARGAAAGYVAEGDRRERVRAGAVAGALGNAVAGLLVGTVGYAFLSGLGGPVSTAAWLRGLAAVAGGTAVVLALAGAALGAAGARVPGGTDSD